MASVPSCIRSCMACKTLPRPLAYQAEAEEDYGKLSAHVIICLLPLVQIAMELSESTLAGDKQNPSGSKKVDAFHTQNMQEASKTSDEPAKVLESSPESSPKPNRSLITLHDWIFLQSKLKAEHNLLLTGTSPLSPRLPRAENELKEQYLAKVNVAVKEYYKHQLRLREINEVNRARLRVQQSGVHHTVPTCLDVR